MEVEHEQKGSKFKRICVFCGSSEGNNTVYGDTAIVFGEELICRQIDLVYGGGSIGLMGLISETVHHGGGYVLGIISKLLINQELTSVTVGEVKVVANMHAKKAEMDKISYAFVALQGGYRTLKELLEVISWVKLDIYDKSVELLNVNGYYNSLLSLIEKAVEEEFICPNDRHIVVSAPTAKELIEKLENYVPCHEEVVPKRNWKMAKLAN